VGHLNLRVLFRADASIALGSGHVMRCLALADALKKQGADCTFASTEGAGNLLELIKARGFAVHGLPVRPDSDSNDEWQADAELTQSCMRLLGPDWLVVDHYWLGMEWERRQRGLVRKILAIDDLGRQHCCDVILDQNLESPIHAEYGKPRDAERVLLLGPTFALLRPEFAALRERSLARRSGSMRRILISMGGVDHGNETSKAVAGVAMTGRADFDVDVVIGAQNPNGAAVADACRQLANVRIFVQTSDMAMLMLSADCAITAGGSTTWERCCLGLPALATVLSEDQVAILDAGEKVGAHIALGRSENLKPADYAAAVMSLTPDRLKSMSQAAARICDGLGASRVAAQLH
jgi:UDP-2,4-diacetamido-2,4,6-trideoxy-beta-L-altropyranose hydrolase